MTDAPTVELPVRWMLGRIHRATITRRRIGLVRRLVIDSELLLCSGLAHLREVEVTAMDRPATATFRVTAGPAGSHEICLRDLPTGRFRVGDRLVICGYAAAGDQVPIRPRLLVLGPHNIVLSEAR